MWRPYESSSSNYECFSVCVGAGEVVEAARFAWGLGSGEGGSADRSAMNSATMTSTGRRRGLLSAGRLSLLGAVMVGSYVAVISLLDTLTNGVGPFGGRLVEGGVLTAVSVYLVWVVVIGPLQQRVDHESRTGLDREQQLRT